MRILSILLAVLLAAPVAASAQTTTTSPAGQSGGNGSWIDLGLRGSDLTGDAARYERYRDLGDGLFLEGFRLRREYNGWYVSFLGDHAGRSDQRFSGSFVRPGRFKGYIQWDEIPMVLSRSTLSLFSGIGSDVVTIDDAIQSQVQASVATLPGLFSANALGFGLESRRHIFETGLEFLASPEVTLKTTIRQTDREGVIAYGGSFGHSSLVETPAPVNHRLTDVDASAEFVRDPVLLRGGYTASLFTNEVTTLTFDSPFRLTDSTTPSRGRHSLPPSNSYFGVNGLASVKLPSRSRATAYVSIGSLKDAGDAIMPQTINTAVAQAPIARGTVDGEGRVTAVNLSFTSRPTRMVDFGVKYRSYDYDNRTPEFLMTERQAYDNAPSVLTEAVHTEPFGIVRHSFDADLRVTPIRFASAAVGYGRIKEERNHRAFESTTEDIVRVTFDSVGNQYFSVRSRFEHSERKAEGFDVGALTHANEQPGMRHFDVAARDRNRFTLLGTMMPVADLAITTSVAWGEDDYNQSVFGLRDNTHRVYGLGFDATPAEQISVGLSYSYERYYALSRSRQANPGVQFDDPSRNWASEGTDRAHSFLFSVEFLQIADRVDLMLSYDFNRARATYNYITGAVANRTLPEEVVVTTTLPTPTQLPPTFSELQRAVTNLTYWTTSRLGLGLSYWYERYDVRDFTLDVESTPNLARGSTLLMGYLYQPYRANTVWGRLIYRW